MTATHSPKLVLAADLWTLVDHPSIEAEWSMDDKVRAIKNAGFDAVGGFASAPVPLARSLGLRFAGLFDAPDGGDFARPMQALLDQGAETINVQLGRPDTPADEALRLALRLMEEAGRRGANLHIEVHRGTCTETPEKVYALADAYRKITGETLRLNFDHSHLAVVRHLAVAEFSPRLLERSDLLQNGNLTHCRPFNGHHCQVPVTDGRGGLTPELQQYLPFVADLFRCWLGGPRPFNELWVVPELGPVSSGYGISTWPAPWDEAQILKRVLETVWRAVLDEFGGGN